MSLWRLVLILLIFAAGLYANAASPLRLDVRTFSKVDGTHAVTLADVVDARKLPAALVKKMSKVVLADSPRLGEQRRFTSQMISEVVRAHFGRQFVSVHIPNQVTVANRGGEIDGDAVKQDLLNAWKARCTDCRFIFRAFSLPAVPAELRSQPYRLDVKSTLPRGAFSEKILIRKPSGDEGIFWVNGQIEVQKRVPVATRTLPQGLKLSEQDVRYEWRDVTYASDGVPDAKALFSQEVKMGIAANQIVWANSLTREKAVKRGEIVSVSTKEKAWQMTLQAVTEQDGFIGDTVNVRNLQTNKIISGEVIAPGEVVVR